ncbi:MAG: Glyoxylate/hydroxypyruvate reductase B [Phycisphaerae bacterium]|nr:Glyoxylate/hydroxypyruvate reductase B [Phycisphaerae bacterium]
MNVLVADSLPESCLEQIRMLGCRITYKPDLKADDLPGRIADQGILVVRSTQVLPATIEKSNALQMIIRAGAGVNTIAVDAASAHGIFVTNCPGKNATAVAELALGLILALDRRIVEGTVDLRAGRWNKKEYSQARGLAGRTLGILGFGQIGRLLALRAQACEMRVCAWSRSLTPERASDAGVEFCNWPREVARRSDIVSIHCAATPETHHLVDAEFLENMPAGAYLINTARGGIIDEQALASAVRQRGIRVGLDVFEDEPEGGTASFKSPLLDLPGVIGTHHIGASTDQAQDAIAAEVARIVRRFLLSGEVLNCVNIAEQTPATWQLIVRHYDRVGVLAAILEVIRGDQINAEEITNRVFAGARAACCSIMLSDRPSEAAMERIRGSADVIQAEIRAVV